MNRCLNLHSALQYESRKGPHHPLVKTSSSERIEQLLLPQQAATGLEMTLKLLSLKILIVFFAFSINLFTYSNANSEDQEYLSADCANVDKKDESIGCIGHSLIASEESYWIEFKDEHELSAQNCLLTCQTVYPNTRYSVIAIFSPSLLPEASFASRL